MHAELDRGEVVALEQRALDRSGSTLGDRSRDEVPALLSVAALDPARADGCAPDRPAGPGPPAVPDLLTPGEVLGAPIHASKMGDARQEVLVELAVILHLGPGVHEAGNQHMAGRESDPVGVRGDLHLSHRPERDDRSTTHQQGSRGEHPVEFGREHGDVDERLDPSLRSPLEAIGPQRALAPHVQVPRTHGGRREELLLQPETQPLGEAAGTAGFEHRHTPVTRGDHDLVADEQGRGKGIPHQIIHTQVVAELTGGQLTDGHEPTVTQEHDAIAQDQRGRIRRDPSTHLPEGLSIERDSPECALRSNPGGIRVPLPRVDRTASIRVEHSKGLSDLFGVVLLLLDEAGTIPVVSLQDLLPVQLLASPSLQAGGRHGREEDDSIARVTGHGPALPGHSGEGPANITRRAVKTRSTE